LIDGTKKSEEKVAVPPLKDTHNETSSSLWSWASQRSKTIWVA